MEHPETSKFQEFEFISINSKEIFRERVELSQTILSKKREFQKNLPILPWFQILKAVQIPRNRTIFIKKKGSRLESLHRTQL